jgi:putative ABC transport system permease protein
MSGLWRDLRYAIRVLAKSPGYTVVAVLALTLGIGANAIVFTLTNAMLFKGFPFDRSDRIVYMGTRDIARTGRYTSLFGPVSYPDFRDWRAQAKSFTGIAAARFEEFTLSDDTDLPETLRGVEVSTNLFQVIGQRPAIGRDFTSADEAPGAPEVVMLTYGLWQRRYGKDRSLVGRIIHVNGMPTTVIGIMPPEISFPFDNDLWLPLIPTADSEKRDNRQLVAFGRLADGTTLQSSRVEMETIGHNLARAYPLTNRNFVSVLLDYDEFYVGPEGTAIFVVMLAGVGFVLLIACADIANLQLARAVSRAREVSIRIAVGASRRHLIRQLLIESLALSAVGGFLGWLLGMLGMRILDIVWTPFGKPRWIDFSMDYRDLAYLFAISIGTGILFGLVPALRLSRMDINSALTVC